MTTQSAWTRKVRVLIVDDHPIVRLGLVDLFNEEPDMEVVGAAASVGDAQAIVAATSVDLAVVDLMLGVEDGLRLVASLSASTPRVNVLVLSSHDERLYAGRSLQAGARGYVTKSQPAAELVAAARSVAAGRAYVSPVASERILANLGPNRPEDALPYERLSNRERQVFRLLGRGLVIRQVAAEMKLSVKTVETHVTHIKAKLGVANGRELVRLAFSWAERAPG